MAKAAAKSEYRIGSKRNGRFTVRRKGGAMVNGEEKLKALAAAGKITLPKPKPKAAEETASGEAPAE